MSDQPNTTALATLVDYGNYDVDEAASESSEASKHTGGGEWYKLKAGPNILRLLPPGPGGKSPFKVRWRHWVDLPGGQSVKFNCPKMMGGKFCPICEKAEQYKQSPEKAARDKGFAMSPSRRALFAAIDRTDPDRGPVIVDVPGTSVYDPLVSMRQDQRGGGDFTHPISGFDVIIKRTGAGGKQGTNYEVLADRNNTQLADTVEQMNEWILGQPDLSKYMTIPTPDEIKEMFAEAMGQADANAPRGAAPASAPKLGAGAARGGRTAQSEVLDTSASEESPEITDDDIPF